FRLPVRRARYHRAVRSPGPSLLHGNPFMRTVQYFLSPRSPWTYLGHDRLMKLAERHGVEVQPMPFDLSDKVFPISGGLPLPKRSPQRQAYRLIELRRWSSWLETPLVLQPRYFPVDD